MIDLANPIQTSDWREAKYLGELPDGRHVFAHNRGDGKWYAGEYGLEAEKQFINITPAPPKLTGFCPVVDGSRVGSWSDNNENWSNRIEWTIDLSTLTEKNFVLVAR